MNISFVFSFRLFKDCLRKNRHMEQCDVSEFFEWRLEKVSNCWLRETVTTTTLD